MLPIGPLMIEHRLIEKMIKAMEKELHRMETEETADPVFIGTAVDFIRVYADRCHHGKEQEILFRELEKKAMSEEYKKTMNELVDRASMGKRDHKGPVRSERAVPTGKGRSPP
jgi:hemerythrin-like domain-containing protein